MENRKNLIRELMDAPENVKRYLAGQAQELFNDDFFNVLPGLLVNPESADAVRNNLKLMASWDK